MSLNIKYSAKGLQCVVPVGISTYDSLVGGGFALTSLNIIDEDFGHVYSTMFAKAYVSTGIQSNQRILIFSPTIKGKQSRFVNELPLSQNESSVESEQKSESLNIAFRYSRLSRFTSENEGEISKFKLDYGQYLSKQTIESSSIQFYDHTQILEVLENEVNLSQASSSVQVTRIYIDHLGSALSFLSDNSLPNLLFRVKVLLRRLPKSVCLATVWQHQSIDVGIQNQADSVTRLIGFFENSDNNRNSNPYSSDYVGILHISRLSRLNSFAPYNASLESCEYGLKLRNSKRNLLVEKLALPPDLSETVNRFTCSH